MSENLVPPKYSQSQRQLTYNEILDQLSSVALILQATIPAISISAEVNPDILLVSDAEDIRSVKSPLC
jgi:hypothetical protein